MAVFVGREELERIGSTTKVLLEKSASALSERSNVFLSHASLDSNKLLRGVLRVLKGHGAVTYADVLDPVAKQLDADGFGAFFVDAIADCGRLVALTTSNSRRSRWVPWELGLAHGLHGRERTAVWPVVEPGAGQASVADEYHNVYPTVQWSRRLEKWIVFDPVDSRHWSLRAWLELGP